MIVRCRGCGASIGTQLGGSSITVGEVMRLTKHECVLRDDGGHDWLCPACVARVVPHVREIVGLMRGSDFFWGCLPHLLAGTPVERLRRAVAKIDDCLVALASHQAWRRGGIVTALCKDLRDLADLCPIGGRLGSLLAYIASTLSHKPDAATSPALRELRAVLCASGEVGLADVEELDPPDLDVAMARLRQAGFCARGEK
jgi:hypothetical protein